MSRYLVITDMHFGTPESAVNDAPCRGALIGHLVAAGPWDEVVLAGDILDANLSTFQRSIEGDAAGTLCGLRRFLAELHAAARPKNGLPGIAKRWIYVPGNHDYKVWDILASRVAFEDPIAAGEVFGEKVKLPLQRYAWRGAEAFLSGLWKGADFDASASVTVEYPDHRIAFGTSDLVVTHGHYLDASQTRFNDLSECLPPGISPGDAAEVVRRIVIETAQYQTVASAMSFRRDTKNLVDALFGPAGLGNRLHKLLSSVGAWLASLSFRPEGKRGAALSPGLLRNVDAYLEHFSPPRGPVRPVRWLVFGHTHAQGGPRSTLRGVEVWNAGSCYPDDGKAITFAQVEAEAAGPRVELKGIARRGNAWVAA